MRPSTELKKLCIDDWTAASSHDFCQELAKGTLPLEKMKVYLVQDYTFIDNFVKLAASAIHHAPTLADRLPLAAFLGIIAGPENTYFQRSFDTLGITTEERINPQLLEPCANFQMLMAKAAQSGQYAHMIAVLCVAEWTYLSWADNFKSLAKDLPFYFQEWIDLHSGDYFESVVEHLRSQLDTAYTSASHTEKESIQQYFQEAVRLEKQFFDSCYQTVK
ncbi:TenA family protein [Marinomonas sp. 2405UD66-6]|uniref:TenA family protein n=1 Tax=Marinomonas sp. 2405UD66-6 TaxID=3391834 RepID=UPI0039C90D9B